MIGKPEAVKQVVEQLMAIRGDARCHMFNRERDRFNMPHSAETSVNPALNANYIRINEQLQAIACQFPMPQQLEHHFKMLAENRTPVLVVLASRSDMNNHQLPDYFSHSARHGGITVDATLLNRENLGDGISANMSALKIAGHEATIDVPVVHVHNWPDHQTVSPQVTHNLVKLINSIVKEKREFYAARGSRAVHDEKKLLPVIHCRAGVGRTGQAIAAMAMEKYPELELYKIIRQLRHSRNDVMVQTPPQMETLHFMDLMRQK